MRARTALGCSVCRSRVLIESVTSCHERSPRRMCQASRSTGLVRLRLAIASQPRCTLPGDSFLRRVYWARLVSSSSFRKSCFPLVIRPSRQSTGCNSAARPPAAGKDPDSCSGRLIPPPCNAGMSRSGCPVRATLVELVAEKARSTRASRFRRSCRQISPLRSSQELRPGLS